MSRTPRRASRSGRATRGQLGRRRRSSRTTAISSSTDPRERPMGVEYRRRFPHGHVQYGDARGLRVCRDVRELEGAVPGPAVLPGPSVAWLRGGDRRGDHQRPARRVQLWKGLCPNFLGTAPFPRWVRRRGRCLSANAGAALARSLPFLPPSGRGGVLARSGGRNNDLLVAAPDQTHSLVYAHQPCHQPAVLLGWSGDDLLAGGVDEHAELQQVRRGTRDPRFRSCPMTTSSSTR